MAYSRFIKIKLNNCINMFHVFVIAYPTNVFLKAYHTIFLCFASRESEGVLRRKHVMQVCSLRSASRVYSHFTYFGNSEKMKFSWCVPLFLWPLKLTVASSKSFGKNFPLKICFSFFWSSRAFILVIRIWFHASS